MAREEYIKKEDLFAKTAAKNTIWLHITNAEGKNLKEIVEDLPTYVVPEREKGEWVERRVENREGSYLECSRCGCLPPTLECADRIVFMRSNFCPYCGADMGERIE